MKKASLALSTNAIVVLIIAITILGLALTFTRTIFGTLTENVAAVGKGNLLDNPPSYEDPMTLSRSEADVQLGKNVKVKVGYFNNAGSAFVPSLEVSSCSKNQANTLDNFSVTIPPGVEIDTNEDVVFSIVIEVKKGALKGPHVCTFQVVDRKDDGDDDDVVLQREHFYVNVV